MRRLPLWLTLWGLREDGARMSEAMAEAIWMGLAGYLGLGLVAGLGVILFGLKRLPPGAEAMPMRVRLLILPGLAALWPVIAMRLAGVKPPEDRS